MRGGGLGSSKGWVSCGLFCPGFWNRGKMTHSDCTINRKQVYITAHHTYLRWRRQNFQLFRGALIKHAARWGAPGKETEKHKGAHQRIGWKATEEMIRWYRQAPCVGGAMRWTSTAIVVSVRAHKKGSNGEFRGTSASHR